VAGRKLELLEECKAILCRFFGRSGGGKIREALRKREDGESNSSRD
jgi:hypothetical protein